MKRKLWNTPIQVHKKKKRTLRMDSPPDLQHINWMFKLHLNQTGLLASKWNQEQKRKAQLRSTLQIGPNTAPNYNLSAYTATCKPWPRRTRQGSFTQASSSLPLPHPPLGHTRLLWEAVRQEGWSFAWAAARLNGMMSPVCVT